MKVSEFDMSQMLKFSPDTGRLMLGSQRMTIMSARSVGILLEEIYKTGGENMARLFFRRWGEAAGRDDARLLKEEYNPDTDMDWIALGPTIHTWEGIVRAVPTALEFDRGTGHFFMTGVWENSFFGEQWLKIIGKSNRPVCDILTGYATGYISEFFGREVVAKEPTCIACGDAHCSWEARPKDKWE